MNTVKPLFLLFVLLSCAVPVVPQTPRRSTPRRTLPVRPARTPSNAVDPTPSRAATTAETSRDPVTLAIVNGENITSADIDPAARSEFDKLDDRVAEARRQVIELQINTMLLEDEAARRRMSTQQLYELEIEKKIPEPTAAEVDKVIAQASGQYDPSSVDTAELRRQAISFIKSQNEAKITDDFLKRARVANPVVNLVSPNATGLASSTVIATVGGRPITAGAIDERLKPITYKLRLNVYQLTKQALDQVIDNTLLLAEASKRNVPPEDIVRKEVTDKIHSPTQAEISKFYDENKTRINGDLVSVTPSIAEYLQNEERIRLEKDFSTRLRTGANIRVLISEPIVPVQSISVDDDPVRGDANAPVTIVEFTDFQCPSCAAMQPILEEILKQYAGKVKLVVRDFPLNMHPDARKAAEAADAANAQGKFVEYTALLFKNQKALDIESLKKYASQVGLNRAEFDAALDRGKYAAEVKHDVDDGEIYGIDSTPAVFVNGVALREMTIEALRALIDRALAGANAPKTGNR